MTEPDGPVPIGMVGSAAARCLEAIRREGGSVLAVFRRSLYLAEPGSGLACLGPPGIGAGPLNAIAGLPEALDWQARGVRPGDPVVRAGAGFRVGGLAFEAGRAERFRPPRRIDGRSPERLAALRRRARAFGRTDGLAPLVAAPDARSPLIERAWRGIGPLRAWLAEASPADPPAAAVEALLGLGPGLTPSGDDYLGGMMVALFAIGEAGRARRLAAAVLARAEAATGRISRAHLAAAAEGEGAAALHDALTAGDAAALDHALARIDGIGHSSGWDALAGACDALAQRARRRAAISAASALEAATTMPASRSTRTCSE